MTDRHHGAHDAHGADDAHRAGGVDDAMNTEAVNDDPQGSPTGTPVGEFPGDVESDVPELGDEAHPDTALAAERLGDLQRLQAEYVNYRKRVERDRALAKDSGVALVLEALMPVLDDIHLARSHGDLADGTPFAAIADKLVGALGRFGVAELGAPGEAFDPIIHEALMHVQAELPEEADVTTVVQVLQPGWKIGERVLRPARVSVADPA